MNVFSKFRETADAIGFWNALLFAASRVSGALFGRHCRIVKYYFTVQPVVAPDRERWMHSGTFHLRWAGPDCTTLAEADRPAAVIASRFEQGARCLVAESKGRLAGFLWFVIGSYDEDEVRVRFVPEPPGSAAWDFDVMVMPQFRMGRLFSYLWSHANAQLAAHGVKHTMSRISAFNAASLASHRRLGARVVGSAVFVCIGRWQFMYSSQAPHWDFSWRVDRQPTLTIAANRV